VLNTVGVSMVSTGCASRTNVFETSFFCMFSLLSGKIPANSEAVQQFRPSLRWPGPMICYRTLLFFPPIHFLISLIPQIATTPYRTYEPTEAQTAVLRKKLHRQSASIPFGQKTHPCPMEVDDGW